MLEIIKIFKALGDEVRFNILILISNNSMCSKGLAKRLNISEAAISQHIKILKEAELIIGYKVGYHNFYDLNFQTINMVRKYLDSMISDDNIENENLNIKLGCFNSCKHKKCFKNKVLKEEKSMKVCFPVNSNNGVESIPYGHFGTAPEFIICNLETKEVKSIKNGDLGHEHGKCQPMKALSGEDVDAIVVGGIGQGAITRLNSMGIKVYRAKDGNVRDNIEAYKAGQLEEFESNHICNHDGCNH